MLTKFFIPNMLVFAACTTLISTTSSTAEKGFNIAIGMGACAFIQVALNVVAGIVLLVMGKRDPGRALLISAAMLVAVSFCTWLILLSIYG